MALKNIANLIPTIQSVNLVGTNLKKGKKNIVKMGMQNIVGVSLIKETAKLTNTL